MAGFGSDGLVLPLVKSILLFLGGEYLVGSYSRFPLNWLFTA